MTKEETMIMQHAINTAVIERTKDEILSELAYFKRMVKGHEDLNKRIADVAKDVTSLADAIKGFVYFEE